jgi:hypothetical protein
MSKLTTLTPEQGVTCLKRRNIMNIDNVLPSDFNGVFNFTNFTEKDFKAKWGNIEYTFPALKMSPMIIPGATPEEVQHIRKKFARELAIQEWYKTPKFVGMNAHVPGGIPAGYTEEDIKPFVQRCLEPLPLARAVLRSVPSVNEGNILSKDNKGNTVTKILEDGESLLGNSGDVLA